MHIGFVAAQLEMCNPEFSTAARLRPIRGNGTRSKNRREPFEPDVLNSSGQANIVPDGASVRPITHCLVRPVIKRRTWLVGICIAKPEAEA